MAASGKRIGIAVEGTRGDVHPMIELGRAFERAGHSVRVCAPPDFADVIGAAGLECVPVGVSIRAFMGEAAPVLKSRGLAPFKAMSRFATASIEHQFDAIPAAMADRDHIFAAGTILAAASAAELHGVPFRFVAYTPAVLPSVSHSPAMFPMQTASPRANRLLWWLCFAGGNLLGRKRINRRRDALGLPPIRDVFASALSECPILAVDYPLAPMPEDSPIPFQQIRGLHAAGGEALPAKLEAFLEAGPPPVYIGFGSMTDSDPDATTRAVLSAVDRVGCRALISKGWAGLGDVPLPEGVMAIDPVSHADLFPRMAAVVHHGGSGTTHTAARSGVPQVIVPHLLDQFYFARRVVELGVGPPPLASRRLDAEQLAALLDVTLDNEFLAERARDLSIRLMSAGNVEPDVERLLEPEPASRA